MCEGAMIGKTLGHYRIFEQIGAGGMGVVYRASDTQLGRDVALKVLPEGFARDYERMARFKREAQLLATLNHPGIATIYGLEESGDVRAIAMELVDGPTLADCLYSGPIPLEDALPIARQIAEALEAAHEKGIIHRDLKPANVKVTPGGKVKVLDFGLAKALVEASGAGNITGSPTISEIASRAGVILGTAAYMSPEQARGKPLDRRTDVWSFGCLLYEMLTGKNSFGGDTVSDTIARIIEREPDWHALPEQTPQGVRQVLRRCLQKDPQRRLHDIADARLEIEETLASPLPGMPAAAPPAPESRPVWWRSATLWISIMIGAAGIGFGIWTLRHTPPSAHGPLVRFSVTLPLNEQLGGLDFPSVALSPTGTHLAYVANRGSLSRLFLHRMDNLQDEPISGTEHALGPFFSPDGQWLGFFADGKLMKTSIGGGAPTVLCDAPIGFGAVWGTDNTITFAPTGGSGLMQVSAAGGTPREITKLNEEKGEFSHRWPDLLPGGKTLLFTVGATGSWDDAQIVAQSLDTGERHVLITGGTFPHYLPTGHLVYARGGSLMAVPFDITYPKVTGPAMVVLSKVWVSIDGAAQFGLSPLGHIVYVAGSPPGREHTLVWVDRSRVMEPLASPGRNYSEPRLSPDGRRLAVTITQNSENIWIHDVPTGSFTQLTFEGNNSMPVWTLDGARIAFASNKAGALNLFWKQADGSGNDERLTTGGQSQAPYSWSPRSHSLVFVEQSPTTGRDIWMLSIDRDLKSRAILQSPFNETGPALSPDGRWLAYVSDESGHNEVYVIPLMSAPGAQARRQVSTDGGTEPLWSREGSEIFYRVGNKMMACKTRTAPDFQAGPPQLLFEGAYEKGRDSRPAYDVTADGRRFLMLRSDNSESAPTRFEIVLEWFEELKRRVAK
jgi:serine/threonine protein kinase/Tol biopolymer transport system component